MEISLKALCKLRFLFFLSFAGSPLCGQVESDESFVQGMSSEARKNYNYFTTDFSGRLVVGSERITYNGHSLNGPFVPLKTSVEGLAYTLPNPCRFQADGSPDIGFRPPSSAAVRGVVIDRTHRLLIIYGADTDVPGLKRLVRLNPDDSVDMSFDPAIADVKLLLIDEKDRLVVAGDFDVEIGGVSYRNLARMLPDGSVDATFRPDPNGAVDSLFLQDDGQLVVGGAYDLMGGNAASGLVRLSESGILDSGFNAPAVTETDSLVHLPDGGFLHGGEINTAEGLKTGWSWLDSTGTDDTNRSGMPDATKRSFIFEGRPLHVLGLAGGNFLSPGKGTTALSYSINGTDGSRGALTETRYAFEPLELIPTHDSGFIRSYGLGRFIGKMRLENSSAELVVGAEEGMILWDHHPNSTIVREVAFESFDPATRTWNVLPPPSEEGGDWLLSGFDLTSVSAVRARGRAKTGSGTHFIEAVANVGTGTGEASLVLADGSLYATGDVDMGRAFPIAYPSVRLGLRSSGGFALENPVIRIEGPDAALFRLHGVPPEILAPDEEWRFLVEQQFGGVGTKQASLRISADNAPDRLVPLRGDSAVVIGGEIPSREVRFSI